MIVSHTREGVTLCTYEGPNGQPMAASLEGFHTPETAERELRRRRAVVQRQTMREETTHV